MRRALLICFKGLLAGLALACVVFYFAPELMFDAAWTNVRAGSVGPRECCYFAAVGDGKLMLGRAEIAWNAAPPRRPEAGFSRTARCLTLREFSPVVLGGPAISRSSRVARGHMAGNLSSDEVPIYVPLLVIVVLMVWLGLPSRRPLGARPRGFCHACGYDLRGSPRGAACPECGAAWNESA